MHCALQIVGKALVGARRTDTLSNCTAATLPCAYSPHTLSAFKVGYGVYHKCSCTSKLECYDVDYPSVH